MPRYRPYTLRRSADRLSCLFPLYFLFVALFTVMQIFFLRELERTDNHLSDLVLHTTSERKLKSESIDENATYLIEQHPWSDIETVLDKESGEIIGDPQFLLDFAIVGFEKCGTSTLMKWLGGHPEIHCFQKEVYDLFQGHADALVTRIYKEYINLPGKFKIGYKNPIDIFQPSTRDLLDKHWPQTKLFILLRHPVRYVSVVVPHLFGELQIVLSTTIRGEVCALLSLTHSLGLFYDVFRLFFMRFSLNLSTTFGFKTWTITKTPLS